MIKKNVSAEVVHIYFQLKVNIIKRTENFP